MQFHRKTRNDLSSNLIKLLIKAIISLAFISIIIFILSKLNFPSPNKTLNKKIPNEQFKVVK